MVGQRLEQPVAGEPADGDVDLGFTHQPTVVDDSKHDASQQKPQRRFWVDARPSHYVRRVATHDFGP